MGKLAPDNMIDGALDIVASTAGGTNMYCICSGSPATYADAITNNVLATISVTSGCFVIADDTSGRKLTMGAKTAIPITDSGFAEAVAIVDTAGSALLYVTSCTGQSLVAAGTVDTPSWKINIQDPT